MSRLNQTFQNFFIRLGSVLSGFFRGISGFFGKIFEAIVKLFGFSGSGSTYFVESEQPQSENKTTAVSSTFNDLTQTTNTTETKFNNRKPRQADMDYFMDMARKVNKN